MHIDVSYRCYFDLSYLSCLQVAPRENLLVQAAPAVERDTTTSTDN